MLLLWITLNNWKYEWEKEASKSLLSTIWDTATQKATFSWFSVRHLSIVRVLRPQWLQCHPLSRYCTWQEKPLKQSRNVFTGSNALDLPLRPHPPKDTTICEETTHFFPGSTYWALHDLMETGQFLSKYHTRGFRMGFGCRDHGGRGELGSIEVVCKFSIH